MPTGATLPGQPSGIDGSDGRALDTLIDDRACRLDAGESLRTVTLINVAHSLERIGGRVVSVAADIVFVDSGAVLDLA